jgi:hypothetical protein
MARTKKTVWKKKKKVLWSLFFTSTTTINEHYKGIKTKKWFDTLKKTIIFIVL